MIVVITRAIKKYVTTTSYETIKKEAYKLMDYGNHKKTILPFFGRHCILRKRTYPIDDGLHTGDSDKKFIGIKNVCVYRDVEAWQNNLNNHKYLMNGGAKRLVDNGWELSFEARDVSDIERKILELEVE